MKSNISGVYALTNAITGNRYVGSSKDISNRRASHFWQLRNSRHKNNLIQSDFDQYGADSFKFEVLELADVGELRALEQRHIDSGNYRYNIAPKAAGGGAPVTDAIREKMSKAHKGKRHTPETIEKLRNRPKETNGVFSGFYHTPAGVFPSSYAAEEGMGGVLNFATIRRWCQKPDKVISKQSYGRCSYLKSLGEGVIGKTHRDLGFSFEAAVRSD